MLLGYVYSVACPRCSCLGGAGGSSAAEVRLMLLGDSRDAVGFGDCVMLRSRWSFWRGWATWWQQCC
jgi:hypothetical protein